MTNSQSERMTVEEAWAAHGSIIGLARLSHVNDQITNEDLLREHDRARAIVRQAILEEHQEKVTALVEAGKQAVHALRYDTDFVDGWEVRRKADAALTAALRAVSQRRDA